MSWVLALGQLFRIIEIETNRGSLAIEIHPVTEAFKPLAMGVLSMSITQLELVRWQRLRSGARVEPSRLSGIERC